jgi:dolichol-phosphate mannosyltransferase
MINYISDINLPENIGDFKLLSRRAITHILEFGEADPYMRGLSIWIGFNQETIPYTRLSRFAGKTHFSIFSKGPFLEFIRGITSFSVAPLYFCFLLGCTALVGIIIFSLITLILKFLNLLVPGSAGILLLILGLGSIIIFMLGIIALYISRIYIETKKRPRYIIDNIINKKKGKTY